MNEPYSASVGGLILKVRRTELGWEASISGPATGMDKGTAQGMSKKFAEGFLGKEVGEINWIKAQ